MADVKVSKVGSYIELGGEGVLVSKTGAYIELGGEAVLVSKIMAYLEIEGRPKGKKPPPPPPKGAKFLAGEGPNLLILYPSVHHLRI